MDNTQGENFPCLLLSASFVHMLLFPWLKDSYHVTSINSALLFTYLQCNKMLHIFCTCVMFSTPAKALIGVDMNKQTNYKIKECGY